MATISYTTPYLSANDEKREVAALSEEEEKAIEKDIYGRCHQPINHGAIPSSVKMPESVHVKEDVSECNDDTVIGVDDTNNDDDAITYDLLDKMNIALDEIPESHKEDFSFVRDFYPHLIERESPPQLFLRCEDYNPSAAASRLVKYWEMRDFLFEDKAFESMTLRGALNDDIDTIINKLPNSLRILPDDQHGRTVLCTDNTAVDFEEHDENLFVRYLWFVVHQALKKESTQKNGIVIINIHSHVKSTDFLKRNTIAMIVKSVQECLPIKVRCLHFCHSALPFRIRMPVIKFFMKPHMRRRIQSHTSMKKSNVLKELEAYGFRRDHLPKSIGGFYNVEPSWMHECRSIIGKNGH